MSDKEEHTGRLAFRTEDVWWTAYWAQLAAWQLDMKDAIELGRVHINAVAKSEELKDGFRDLMKKLVTVAISEEGLKAEWLDPPESERPAMVDWRGAPITDDTLIDELELSVRSMNCLRNNVPGKQPRAVTVGDVIGWTDAELMRIPNFGKISLKEVRDVIGGPREGAVTMVEQEIANELRLAAEKESNKMDRTTYDYLKPNDQQLALMAELREAARNYGAALDRLPDGPDKTWCIRNHRTTAMWANVAITRQPDGAPR